MNLDPQAGRLAERGCEGYGKEIQLPVMAAAILNKLVEAEGLRNLPSKYNGLRSARLDGGVNP